MGSFVRKKANKQGMGRHRRQHPPAHSVSVGDHNRDSPQELWTRIPRETLPFSKKLANHISAIHYVICHDNLTRAFS